MELVFAAAMSWSRISVTDGATIVGSSGFLVGGTGPRAGKQATALEDRRSMECRLGRTRADGGKVARSSYPLYALQIGPERSRARVSHGEANP